MTKHTIAGEFDKIKNKLHREDKAGRPKDLDVEDVISEEIDLNTEAAVNISEYDSREHTNHMSIDDMRE